MKNHLTETDQKASLDLRVLAGLTAFGALFCLIHYLLGDLNKNHVAFISAGLFLFLAHRHTRVYLILALPMLFKEMMFDALRYVPFDWIKPIHVAEPYAIDKAFFSIPCGSAGSKLIHECLALHSSSLLDFTCGIFYHALDPIVFILLFLLWKMRDRESAERFAMAYLVINLFAFATYLLYPAAAPWYVTMYGFIQPLQPVAGNAAGLVNFDRLIGINLSADMYKFNPYVFGAIPSMHAGFTMLCWLYSAKIGRKFATAMGIYAIFMWFAALYLQHHYLIDLLIGQFYAVLTYFIIEKYLKDRIGRAYRSIFSILLPRQEPDV